MSVQATAPDVERIRHQISYLARSASVELTPREIMAAANRRLLPRGSRIFIPHLPDADEARTASAAKALYLDGMVPVPHIAARRLRSAMELDDLLDGLAEAGCREALVIGGGVNVPLGPYASAAELLDTGKLQKAQITRVGIAGHPQGSPDVSEAALQEALITKSRFAAAGVLDMYIVTQFCFDATPILAWESAQRARGNTLPIHIGLPGVTSIAQLLRYARICGVKASTGFMRHGAAALGSLALRWRPNALVARLAAALAHEPASMIRQLHFFPFGGFPDTVAFIRAVGEGRYEVKDMGNDIDIVVNEDAQ